MTTSLAENHWDYVKGVIENENAGTHEITMTVIDYLRTIEYHYKTAMIHGYKHGVQDAQSNRKM